MIKLENYIGNIFITDHYLRELVEYTVCNCFGVAGICPATPLDSLISRIFPQYGKKGIILYMDNRNRLVIELHISVAYGINISTVAKSVAHKVKFAVSQSVRNAECRINVFVDDIKS